MEYIGAVAFASLLMLDKFVSKTTLGVVDTSMTPSIFAKLT